MAYSSSPLATRAQQLAANTATTAIDTTGATLLLVAAVQADSGGQTISDSKGNTWNALTAHSQFATCEINIFYAINPIVGAGHTFQSNFANSHTTSGGLIITAWGGADTSSPFDVQNGTGYFASTAQAGSITPSANNELVIALLSSDNPSGPYAVDSGFTIAASFLTAAGVSNGLALAYLIQTTAGATNPTWSGGLNFGAAMNASFKAGAAAAEPTPYNPWPQIGPIIAQRVWGWLPSLPRRRPLWTPTRALVRPAYGLSF